MRSAFPPPERYSAQARSLGSDHTLQQRPAKRNQTLRWRVHGGKCRRWHMVKGSSRQVSKPAFFGGMLQGATFGCDLASFEGVRLKALRSQAAKAMHAPVAGASQAALWAVLPAAKDPGAITRLAPLRRLHREVWMATGDDPPDDIIRLGELAATFDKVNDVRPTRDDARRRRQDPLSAAIRSAHEVGWSFVNVTTIRRPEGDLVLQHTSPAELKRLFLAAWHKRQEALADRALARRAARSQCQDTPGSSHPDSPRSSSVGGTSPLAKWLPSSSGRRTGPAYVSCSGS